MTQDSKTLAVKTRVYEMLMWAFYEAYVPSYALSYDVLGDQECYSLKYAWELTIYFSFYVFPFINQLFTDVAFVIPYLDLFAKLGALNQRVHSFITDYYRWKKSQPVESGDPKFCDFTSFAPLARAQDLIYEVGISSGECLRLLRQQLASIEELARFIAAYIFSAVVGDESLLENKQLNVSIRIDDLSFDPAIIHRTCSGLHPANGGKLAKVAPDFPKQFGGRGTRKVPSPASIPRVEDPPPSTTYVETP